MVDLSPLAGLLRRHLPLQRWYAGSSAPVAVEVLRAEVIVDGWPGLVRALVGADGDLYQVLVGLRPEAEHPELLRGRDEAVIGRLPTDLGPALAYDAVLDSELGLALLRSMGEEAQRCRPMGLEQSNSSLVFDERLVLKLYRRLHPGKNRDVELTQAVADQGFEHVARPVAVDRVEMGGDHFDLALMQPFLGGGVDGWAMAFTSLRDLLGTLDTQSVPVISGSTDAPASVATGRAGGDFAGESHRLGEVTAGMHLILAAAFGSEPFEATAWAADIEAQVRSVAHPRVNPDGAGNLLDRLREAGEAGPAMRLHGDLHLGQALRTDSGWYILDFEGEPDRPPEERNRPSSPLRDVAGMLRSFHYASQVAMIGRDTGAELAEAWETRNRWAFFDGYARVAGAGGILPASPGAVAAVLGAFELEKAVYELAYERGHRPDWEHIPLQALQRLGLGRSGAHD